MKNWHAITLMVIGFLGWAWVLISFPNKNEDYQTRCNEAGGVAVEGHFCLHPSALIELKDENP